MTTNRFRDLVLEALRVAVRRFIDAHPNERISGFALLTDDDLRTLGYAACTYEALGDDIGGATRFEPVDWPYGDGQEVFDEAGAFLASLADSNPNHRDHVETAFASLVAAMETAKAEGTLPHDVYCTPISTDPSELLERLEDQAILTLNGPVVQKARRIAVGIDSP
jgi:hypothetical protein